MWSQLVHRTGVSWPLLAGGLRDHLSLALDLQRVEEDSHGGPGVCPEHGKAQENPRRAKLGLRRDPEFCSLAARPSGWPRSPGCCSRSAREGGAVLRQLRVSARPSCPRDSSLPSRAEWARGGTSLRAPPPAGPDSARRARARALCIKPSSPAKVEEVGLPPGWEAGGSPAPVVFREREWVAGAEGGVRPPTSGPGAPETESRRQPSAAPTAGHRAQPKHPSRGLWRVGLPCRSEDPGGALSTLGTGALGRGTRTHPAGACVS